MRDKQAAVKTAKDLVDAATENDEPKFVAHGSLLLAQVELDDKNYSEATKYFQVAAEKGDTPDYQSAAYLKLAELYVQQSDFEKAILAYDRIEELGANYVGVYRAQIGRARMLSKLGKHEASQSLLQELLSNTNYKEFYGEIELELANVYADMGDYPSALAQYQYVDTTYAHTEASANSYFQQGIVYETKLFQYDSAQTAYNKGKAEFPQAAITSFLVRRSDYMNKYRSFKKDIAKYDSIKIAILTPPETLAVHIDSTIAHIDSSRRDSSSIVSGTKSDSVRVKVPQPPSISLDTIDARLAFNKTELGGLFYSVLGKVDSAEFWYKRLLIDHPNSMYVPRALFTLAQLYSQDSSKSNPVVDSLYREIISRFPESEFAEESKRLLGLPPTERIPDKAEGLYASGERLIASGSKLAAVDTFGLLVKMYPNSTFASKAQYAIGWLYEQDASLSDSAVSNYQRLVDLFPNSQYASLVKPRLAEVEQQKQAARQAIRADSAARADSISHQKEAKPPLEKNKDGNQEEPAKTVHADSTSQLKEAKPPLEKNKESNQEQPVKKEEDSSAVSPRVPEVDPIEKPKQP